MELPIASSVFSPLFFFKLFGLGRINPANHKPIGDGKPISSGGSKWAFLTTYNRLPVSMDGYFAQQLDKNLKQAIKSNTGNEFVVIGHPKACTLYSLKKLEKFIQTQRTQHTFITFNDLYRSEKNA